jgi:hypothetical protein
MMALGLRDYVATTAVKVVSRFHRLLGDRVADSVALTFEPSDERCGAISLLAQVGVVKLNEQCRAEAFQRLRPAAKDLQVKALNVDLDEVQPTEVRGEAVKRSNIDGDSGGADPIGSGVGFAGVPEERFVGDVAQRHFVKSDVVEAVKRQVVAAFRHCIRVWLETDHPPLRTDPLGKIEQDFPDVRSHVQDNLPRLGQVKENALLGVFDAEADRPLNIIGQVEVERNPISRDSPDGSASVVDAIRAEKSCEQSIWVPIGRVRKPAIDAGFDQRLPRNSANSGHSVGLSSLRQTGKEPPQLLTWKSGMVPMLHNTSRPRSGQAVAS